MLGFVVLVGENGKRVDPELVRRLEREGPAFLPFAYDRSMRWNDPGKTVFVLAWEAFTEIGGIGSHWHAREDGGLTAFAGYCWPAKTGWTAPGRPWAEQLDRWLDHRDPAEAVDDLFGEFDLLRLDSDGNGLLVTDAIGCGPLFSVTRPDCTVLSNRSGLAALTVTPEGERPIRSPLGAGWLVFDSLIGSDETAYLDVEHVPHGAGYRIDPQRGARMVSPVRTPFEARHPDDLPRSYDELVPLMADEIRALLRYTVSLPVERVELRLSGGKDSRLLAAGVVDAGLQDRIGFMSFGPPEMGDPAVARMIADGLGLRWRLDDRRDRPAAQDLSMVQTHTFLTEGMLSGWNTTSLLRPANDLTLTGVGGDYIGWRQESTEGLACKTREDAIAQFMAREEFDRYGLLLPEAKAWYLDGVVEWVDQRLDRGLEPSLMRALYLRESKMRGSSGIAGAVEPRLWIDGFASPLWFRASFRLPLEQRSGFRFHVDILEELCPQMLDYPLAGKNWSRESYAHRPDAERLAAMKAVYGPGGSAQNWRVVNWETYAPLVRERLLDRGNPLFQVVDYHRLERVLSRTSLNGSVIRYIYGALTAAIWLGGTEDRRQIARPT